MAGDAVAIALAWGIALLFSPPSVRHGSPILVLLAAVLVTLWFERALNLYRSRVATLRTVELAGIVRASLMGSAAVYVITQAWLGTLSVGVVVVATTGAVMHLVVWRTLYRSWLKAQRGAGRFQRPILLVGVDDHARSIYDLVQDQPDLGYRVTMVVGDREQAIAHGLGSLWAGPLDELPAIVAAANVTGAVVFSTAMSAGELNGAVRDLLNSGIHVQLSTGMQGIDHRRLRGIHLGHEPLLYVEASDLTRSQLVTKRAIDIVLSALALIVVAPALLVSAIMIKLHDRGPVLFRQQRVGKSGEMFTVLKLRTMRVDAEAVLDEIASENERNGPLFKMERDPRVTPVGHRLRALSIDELPQLWNVLRGDMSLVGPRPALPAEMAQFDERLQQRTRVMPGITGLWQVEARDNPSFSEYERLDLFYVENWSITLDMMLLLSTVESEIARALRGLRRAPAAAPAATGSTEAQAASSTETVATSTTTTISAPAHP